MTINEYIRQKPYLVWSTTNYEGLSPQAIIEAVLNYGTWEDVQNIIAIEGISNVSKIFFKQSCQPRSNYRPEIKYYFELYFSKYA